MAESLIYPTVVSLPLGYDCTVVPPVQQICGRLTVDEATVNLNISVYQEGELRHETEFQLDYRGGRYVGEPPAPFVWADQAELGATHPAYLEMTASEPDKAAIFNSKVVVGIYSLYAKAGKKGFVSDNAYKYGAPPVIAQVAKFGRYVDAYPVIHLDRMRDLGETIVMINPYHKPILADLRTADGRKARRLRIPPQSARNVNLEMLLEPGEDAWHGHVQMTANNRMITFNLKHSMKDPLLISDHEHLDPFRADATHMPAFRRMRNALGRAIARRRIGV
jgi:hypothetical protein